MLKKIGNKYFAAASLSLLCSCSSVTETSVSNEDIAEVDALAPSPEKEITRYDDALYLLGEMLDAYNAPFLNIQTKKITNDTASRKVPDNLSQMVITAINKIGPQVAYIDFDANRMLTEQALGRQIDISDKLPDIVIRGAITEFDKDLVKKNRNIETDVLAKYHGEEIDLGGESDSDASGSRVAIDMQVVNYTTKRLVSGVQTSNRINLFSTANSNELGVAFNGSGIGFKCSVDRKQGLHSSLRLLIELSILEILGKYYDVPYWKCLPEGKPDKRMVKMFKRNMAGDPSVALKLKVLAYGHGKDVDLTTESFTPGDVVMINELKKEFGTEDDYELYFKLWEELPIESAAKRMRAARKTIKASSMVETPHKTELPEPVVPDEEPVEVEKEKPAPVTSSVQVEPTPGIEVTIPLKQRKTRRKAPTGFGRISEDDF